MVDVPNNLVSLLRSLDVSQFSTISRMKPTTANLPPNNSQKEHLRKYAADSHILMHISGLWMSNQVKRLEFSIAAVPTLAIYMDQAHDSADNAKLDMFELMTLRRLLDKAEIPIDLTSHDPRLFGIPISISDLPTGMIHAFTSKEEITITASSVEDSDSMFKQGNVAECFLFAFFYLLDQRVLLEGRRERGQIIPRFLRVYASHTMNQILFTYFDPFMMAFRGLIHEGVAEDEITIGMLAAVMTGE